MNLILFLFTLFGIIIFSSIETVHAQTEFCEEGFELVNNICQTVIVTTDTHVSYAGGYIEMIIPISLLVVVSIISVVYYKKLKKNTLEK